MNTAWQLPPSALLEDDTALTRAVEQTYSGIYRQYFEHELAANHGLPIETRALRRIGEWRVFLLLTPWMLVRVLVPGQPLALALPDEWQVAHRKDADTVALGPLLAFTLLETSQKAHLNHHPSLGHYLVQPLIFSMEAYRDAAEVFAAWNDVIRTRDANMKKLARDCPLQQEVSRREFFRGMVSRGH